MLTVEDNRRLTEVGPGTAMGQLLRRYWVPALTAAELPAPNGDPVRLRLLSENFVVWRDGDGRLGLFDEYCMHRGASLALGRCEGDGLRCLYHGWKYAVDGTILETPNYKKDIVREKHRAPVYPVREAGGLLWVYLGPRDKEPPFPHYKFMDLPTGQFPMYHATFDCSWVQMLEGTLDPSHANILHQDTLGKRYTNRARLQAGDRDMNDAYLTEPADVVFVVEDTAPHCEVEDTLFGCHGVAILDALAEDGRPLLFARPHTWVMPWLAMPTPLAYVMSVPIDDVHTTFFAVYAETMPDAERERFIAQNYDGTASNYDGYRYRWGEAERWGQDRSAMTHSFSGIAGTVPEDLAMTLSMGPIYDRSRENLVPADQLVIRMRRQLLRAARDLQDGTEPYILGPDETIDLGGRGWSILSDPTTWRETLLPLHERFRVVKRSKATTGTRSPR